MNIFLQHSLRPYQDIHQPSVDILDNLLLPRLCFESVQDLDTNRILIEPFGKRLIMLFSKNRGRNQDCHLLSFHDNPERRPYRHFGFTESRISANKAVHRFGITQIIIYVLNRPGLVRRFFVFKRRRELFIVPIGIGISMTGHNFTGSIDGNQIPGNCPDRFLNPLFRFFPGYPSELIHCGNIIVGADISLDLIQTMNGHIEFVSPSILDNKKIVFHGTDR